MVLALLLIGFLVFACSYGFVVNAKIKSLQSCNQVCSKCFLDVKVEGEQHVD